MDEARSENLVWNGSWGSVQLADWDGQAETIEGWNRLPENAQGSLESRFERLAIDGYLPAPRHADNLGNGISEIKSKGKGLKGHYRAGAFREGKIWFITHFFRSTHTSRGARKQRKIAESIRAEHLARRKRHRR